MTLTIDLSPKKEIRLKKQANALGITSEEYINKLIDLILEASNDDFESWIETLDILSDSEFTAKLKESMKQVETGKITDWEKAKKELGHIAESSSVDYDTLILQQQALRKIWNNPEEDWQEWDEQIKKDSESGKLDSLIDEALDQKKKGKLKDL